MITENTAIPIVETLISLYTNSDTIALFIDFMNNVLVTDPLNRLNPIDALKHPWMQADLYEQHMKEKTELLEKKL